MEPIEDQGLYKVTQFGHDLASPLIPGDNLPLEVSLEGAVGAYMLTKGLQWLSKNVADKVVPGFHDKVLPVCEKACIYGLPLAAAAWMVADPESAQQWIYGKPMDNLGIVSAYLGGVKGASEDLKQRADPEYTPWYGKPKELILKRLKT